MRSAESHALLRVLLCPLGPVPVSGPRFPCCHNPGLSQGSCPETPSARTLHPSQAQVEVEPGWFIDASLSSE